MTKLDELEQAIRSIPDDYNIIRNVLLNHLHIGDLLYMRSYARGALDMALLLSNPTALLDPLRKIIQLL